MVLVEAAKLEDWNLKSAIAHENGKPYDNLYEYAKTYGMLNKYTDNIHPAIKEFYLPWRKQLNLGNFEKFLPGAGNSTTIEESHEMTMRAKL